MRWKLSVMCAVQVANVGYCADGETLLADDLHPTAQTNNAAWTCNILVPPSLERGNYTANTWPDGIVPYAFDPNVNELNRQRSIDAMAEIEAVATIDFIPRTNQADYVLIQSSTVNSSYVGRSGGPQQLRMVSWDYHFIIVHELIHALGFWHEQQRSDRDSYVEVNYSNIQPGTAGNFNIVPGAAPHGPYDFDSVMHYDQCAFSNCCPTGSTCSACLSNSGCLAITVRPPNESWQDLIGQLDHLSAGDRAMLQFRYPPPSDADGDGVPDASDNCPTLPNPGQEDCNTNGVGDACDLASGTSVDCNSNTVPDECELAGNDCNTNGTPDECEPGQPRPIWRQRDPIDEPSSRYGPAMTFHASTNKTVLFGGKEGGNGENRNDTWVWNGQTWANLPTNGPPAREEGVMTYDTDRQVSILFGGTAGPGTSFGDTWEWDGNSWTPALVSGPSERYGHAMCYDRQRQETLVFGGFHAGDHFNDLWKWNGFAWTQILPMSGPWPSPRRYPAMAYDSNRQVVVLFGGTTDPPRNNETWEWNGVVWTLRDDLATSPSPRDVPQMIFDEARGVCVMFGGTTDAGFTNETWEYDGTTWNLRLTDGPSPRYLFGLAYDGGRETTVLFGGYTQDGGVPNDETWILTGCDTDGDGVSDPQDNCPLVANPGQQDCNSDGVGDACMPDCQSNGFADECDIRDGTSSDCNTNGVPDECETASPPTACQILLPVSRKPHGGTPRDIKIVPTGSACGDATSESRSGGLTELRIGFTIPPGGPGPCPVTISEMRCPGCPAWSPYSGASTSSATVEGNDLVLAFTPGLENARTYKFDIGSSVSTLAGQSLVVRVLKGDVTDDGRVDGIDRSVVVGVWTGPGFSPKTDINGDGATNALDRSIVVGAWTGNENCAP